MHHDQARIASAEVRKAHSPFAQPPWPKVLENHIAMVDQLSHHIPASRLADIDRDRLLVAGDRRPPQALAVAGDAPLPHRVTRARGLDLDDLGAVVTEQLTSKGPGDEAA